MKDEGKYYVKLNFEYGKVTPDGTEMKNEGVINWRDMDYDEVTAFESKIVVPGLCAIQQNAADAGYAASQSTVKSK